MPNSDFAGGVVASELEPTPQDLGGKCVHGQSMDPRSLRAAQMPLKLQTCAGGVATLLISAPNMQRF